ncbi:MAG TPA: PA14 domain-containing protein [Verrucomicrobiales bacterium]|nr:PA14 domain-containing protein [Verrucomicrobiales bacterium]
MSFINAILLAGLAAVAIPIIIHLLSRKAAKVIEWGAMQFLLDSIESRKRRIQLEEALLMAARCLLMGLLALAVARPFAPPGSPIPWVVVLPAFLLSLVAFTTSIILRGNRKWFWILMGVALASAAYSVASVYYEYLWNQKRHGTAGRKDIAIIIDGSTSMQLRSGTTGTNFDAAVREAKEIVEKAGSGTSFSVILGGPTPMARIADPVVNRADVQETLGNLKPVRGKMAAFDALATAAVSLSRGSSPNKEIIVFTDGQNIGWDVDNRARWDALVSGFDTFKTKPQVLLRKFPLPKTFRNVAVAGIGYSREVIGTDRPVGIEVSVENTGTEAVTPGGVELKIGDKVLKDPGTGQLQPGARGTVRFLQQFKTPGSFVVTATVKANDELGLDDESVSVCNVVTRLGVLIVDGNPTERFLDRAGSFTALALAPGALSEPLPVGEKKAPAALDPEVMPLSRVGSVPSFQNYDVIILADVPKLPESTARRLAGWVQGGGGLFVLPGIQAQADFYNNWRNADGGKLLPSRMVMENIPKDPVSVALATLSHPALKMVADTKQSDLGGALLQRYWRLEPDAAGGGSTGGRLANGDPFITTVKAGFGSVVMACCNFDTASGNLPSRQAFVALVHQMVYFLANPDGQPLNRQPAAQLNLPLAQASAEGGLKGEYYKGRGKDEPVLVRIDPKLDFQWGNGKPAPSVPQDFRARWTGALMPRYSEEYRFDGWGDDSLTVTVGGKKIFDERGGEGTMKLEAGRYYPVEVEFVDNSGGAALQLCWRSPNQPREIIPTECLTPFPPNATATETNVGELDVAGPDGRPRKASLIFTRGGLVARLGEDIVPGLYRMTLPKDRQKEFGALAAADGTIPFSVADDAAESGLTQLAAADLTFMHDRLDLLEPGSAKDITNILAGREFGEELWKYLAVGALFILLAEIALTRWIAISRRSGEEVAVSFENKFEPSAQFKEALKQVQEGAAS